MGDDKVTVTNDETTFTLFCFRQYSGKNLKNQAVPTKWWYYTCSEDSCKAKYTENFLQLSKITCPRQYKHSHNHLPPSKPKVRSTIKEQCLDFFKVGATPSVVHKYCMNNGIDPTNMPNLVQLKGWKYRLAMEDMLSGMLLPHSAMVEFLL